MLPIYNLLKAPKTINPEEVLHLERKVDFTFFAKTHCYNLHYHNWAISFTIQYTHELPKQLTHDQQVKFRPIIKNDTQYFAYTVHNGQEYIPNLPLLFPEKYHVSKPRFLENHSIQSIYLEDAIHLLSTRKVLFYTWAWISVHAGINSMKDLIHDLWVDKSQLVDNFISDTLQKPEKTQQTYKTFCDSLFTSNPTPAHHALKSLALYKNTSILTENIDLLHEISWVVAYHTEDMILEKQIDTAQFREIDIIVCIWLSYDDRWFLSRYKTHNSNGKILAINLTPPSYLWSEDYLLSWDLQQLLPLN